MATHKTLPIDFTEFEPFATGLDGPEGLVWDPEREVVYAGGRHGQLYRVAPDGSVAELTYFGEGAFVLGLALDGNGRIYVCERGNGRLIRYDPDTGESVDYSTGTLDRPLVTPNYPVFAADGTLYVSDSGTWGSDDGVVFRILPGGRTEVWSTKPSDFTNGLALSSDGGSLYVAESRSSSVWRIPIKDDGSAGAAERVWHVPNTVPDGLAFDELGALYLSLYRPDAIYRLDLDSGSSEPFVHDWTAQYLQAPTNIAFAGRARNILLTANLAGEHLSRLKPAMAVPGMALHRPDLP